MSTDHPDRQPNSNKVAEDQTQLQEISLAEKHQKISHPATEEQKKEDVPGPAGPPPAPKMIEISQFFRFIQKKDKLLMCIGIFSAIVAGGLLPLVSIAQGEVTNTFDPQNAKTALLNRMKTTSLVICLVGIGQWFFAYVYYAFWQHLAQNVSFDLRSRYLHAILRQEVSYFEKENVEQLPSQIGENFQIITEAIGEKYCGIIFSIATMLSGFIVAFAKGADFAGVCFAFVPILLFIMGFFGVHVKNSTIAKMGVVKKMAGVVEESLFAIKLIASFANEDKEIKKFEKLSTQSLEVSRKQSLWTAIFIAMFKMFIFGYFCYTFYISTIYIEKKFTNPSRNYQPYNTGDLLSILIAFNMGLMMIFGLSPNLQALVKAKVVGHMIFDVIDRVPEIRDHENSGEKFEVADGIHFQNVAFRYPTAPENVRNVFDQVSFKIRAGETTAIVGPSGSGKSTIVQMIERYYQPAAGEIYLDNMNIKDIKLKKLRESIGYVSQEPVLIMGSIKDNILLGNRDATDKEIIAALRQANATFILDMPDKLDTYVGSSAVMNLSGGQKQRIAIARALVKKPQLLILDEATSALDPRSEKEVQDAIDRISKEPSIDGSSNKLTIIMIAHRLQTIITANNLLYIENSRCILAGEKGSKEYEEIMQKIQEQNYKHQQDKKEGKENEEQNEKDAIQKENSDILIDKQAVQDPSSRQEENKQQEAGIKRIMSYYRPISLTIIGCIISIVISFGWPIYGLIYSKLLFVMMTSFLPTFVSDRNFWQGMFLLLVILLGITNFIQKYVFLIAGENLTFDVRNLLYKGIMFKHLAWFDRKDRAPGILSNVLSEDIAILNGMTTEHLAILIEAYGGVVIGAAISLFYNWKMGLITCLFVPFISLGGVLMSRLAWKTKAGKINADEAKKDDPYEMSNALLSDILINYRTVIGFGDKNVDYLLEKFDSLLEEPRMTGIKQAHYTGFFFGYSQCIRFMFIGIVFYIAAVLINNYGDDQQDTYICLFTLFMAALGTGISLSSAPSVGKAKAAASKIFSIIDEPSLMDTRSDVGIKEIKRGEIEFINAEFQYPSRTQKVLDNMNLKIDATMKVALVGHSGCGKSTTASLLLRLYEMTKGQLLIDGIDIKDYNIRELRKQIGIVMQEPLLFNTTIKENILYGNENADDAKVYQVAQMANALQFIESNIEDMDKEDVQLEIAKRFQEITEGLKDSYPNLAGFSSLYQKNNSKLTFDEMRLIEELLIQADSQLKASINSSPTLFIETVHKNSGVKGVRWDDIVNKFEYQAIELPALEKQLAESSLKNEQKSKISSQMKFQHDLDSTGLKEVIKQLEITERPDNYDEIIKRVTVDSHERIKHIQLARLNELTKSKENSGSFKLHDGFNKECGLKGSKLSGGQKQRIAIARALIKDPKILILDEATSALDEKSQEIVQQALDRAMEGRTSIVIAHRLSTIRNCDWLFVLNKGQVVEQGTYDNLSANPNSHFYKLKSGMEM